MSPAASILPREAPDRRWRLVIPVTLGMYTISFVDRTNVSLALDPRISEMMRDLQMDNRMKGEAAGVFFAGYVLLQMAGGYWAQKWGAKRLIMACLVAWGACAIACGCAQTFRQFEVARFLLGLAESCVFPAATVMMAGWFPSSERVRANTYWLLCLPVAVVISAPINGWFLGIYGWRSMLVLEGLLPLLWAPLWWRFISDHPRESRWISDREKTAIESALAREAEQLRAGEAAAVGRRPWLRTTGMMIAICFLYNCAAYGCMTFFTSGLQGRHFSGLQYGLLFAAPYVLSAVAMVVNSRHSDRAQERRRHVAWPLALSGACLIASVLTQPYFWLSYVFLCCAIPGPYAALAPFFSIPSETLPRRMMGPVVGLVNAIGNIGGLAGPYFIGWLADRAGSVAIPFNLLGAGLLAAALLALTLPRSRTAGAGAPAPR